MAIVHMWFLTFLVFILRFTFEYFPNLCTISLGYFKFYNSILDSDGHHVYFVTASDIHYWAFQRIIYSNSICRMFGL